MELEIQDLILEFGEQYVPGGQTAKDIKKQLFATQGIEEDFQMVPEDGSVYKSVYATIDEVLQAFAIPFANKGTTTFTPVSYQMGEFKIDTKVSPDKLWKSWAGFFAELDEVDRSKWSFIKWLIQEMIIPKSQEEYITSVMYRGWKLTGFNASPTVDGPTFTREFSSDAIALPANAAMDGIKTILQKLSSRVNIVTLGAIPTDDDDFVTQIEDFVTAIPVAARNKVDYIYMSEALRNKYRNGMRIKYYNSGNPFDKKLLDVVYNKESISVKVDPSMEGSEKFWATVPDNRKRPTKVAATGRFDIQKVDREVKLLTNWAKALVFDVPELVWTDEKEMSIDGGDISTYYPTL